MAPKHRLGLAEPADHRLQGGLESGKKWLQTQIQRLQNFMGMESEIIQDVGEDTGEQ